MEAGIAYGYQLLPLRQQAEQWAKLPRLYGGAVQLLQTLRGLALAELRWQTSCLLAVAMPSAGYLFERHVCANAGGKLDDIGSSVSSVGRECELLELSQRRHV